ncbi:MAG TPA: sigma-54-dependent Fis family transcriptional regulator [Thermoanaerobaculia bacterium]|nr:sigma-54-dependent Fis family transcriptional regulator [Thermoanaerobaculia bacterium]
MAEALARIARALATDGRDGDSLTRLAELSSECERLASAEAERRRRAEALEALLPALAEALDVREVFQKVSSVAREVIPHDLMELGLFNEDASGARVYAVSEGQEIGVTAEFRLPDVVRGSLGVDFFILSDAEIDPATGSIRGLFYTSELAEERLVELSLPLERMRRQIALGVRSHMRVPVFLKGQMVGALLFFSRHPRQYNPEYAEACRRISDHVALAIAHQRLAEEQGRAAEARERAARLEERVVALTRELEAKGGSHQPVGVSKKWKETLELATKVAGTDTTVLLTGESGTGKEVVARFLHRASRRAQGPFVALNCAALPEQLLESELFGSEKGAFTGSVAARPGRIEQAAGGLLFLDEVGEMSPAVQAKFLRVLQEREFQRLGAARALKADVRVVAATNRDLAAAMARGDFREDLYYRLHVFEIRLPPLRERPEDIPALLEFFLREIGEQVGRPAAGISREARDKLLAYAWPGNVRELRNAVERAVILCEGGLITSEHLPMSLGQAAAPAAVPDPGEIPGGGIDLEAVERSYVEQALKQTGNNKSKAARLLGLTRAQLYSRLEKYGL